MWDFEIFRYEGLLCGRFMHSGFHRGYEGLCGRGILGVRDFIGAMKEFARELTLRFPFHQTFEEEFAPNDTHFSLS